MMRIYPLLLCFKSLFTVFVSQVSQVIACPDYAVNVTASLKPGWKYIVQSPGFPDNYPPNITCTWNITGPYGYRLYLFLDYFQIEPSRDCDKDYLVSSSSWYSIQWRTSGYCSVLSHNYIKSLTTRDRIVNRKITYFEYRKMWLKFKSDGTSEFKGFQGEIRLVAPSDDSDCQSYLNDTSGSFTSPKYPLDYPTDHSCTWHIAVPDGTKAKLKFTTFELENTKNEENDCTNDYVEVREGIWRHYGEILGRFCGDTIPPDVISPSNQMWVRFVSDSNSTTVYKGFRAEFSGSSLLTSYTTICFLVFFMTSWL